MSPETKARVRVAGTTALCLLMLFLDATWATYLLLTPPEALATVPTWKGALQLLPHGDPAYLGIVFVAAFLLLLASLAPRLHDMDLLAHITGAGAWGLLAGSQAFGVWLAGGLGAGTLALIVGGMCLHLGLLYYRRR